jgi:metal-responsive CopG/Arc/MetJ family transcriptional regulator
MQKRVELDVPETFLKDYDKTISRHFNTRAEAIRSAMRDQMKLIKQSEAIRAALPKRIKDSGGS